ncbi:hypothetical protein C9374_007717 [Naegleria lovaniensis]|uniref:Uncharacterized protein n=1 Tax=Naegleria lovaniensis TaxID=51637 RepID=A0AA88KLL8_NAELO|nr:uncharacterized protein C9374_007717 [Naegleria lovaniensis]KAG2379079.1 hypothetical protein C9374_007717 [Naegleria lovaniensis]
MTSKYEAMRIKKHFTTSTNLLIRELNTPHFVGSFSNSTELKTIRKSPLSFLPFDFLSQLFTRHEYMLVKSAILVFITASLDHPTSATTTTATAAASTKNNNS